MITEHPDIDRDAVMHTLRKGWDVAADALEFLPVGGDSWSYRSGDVFVNVRDRMGRRKAYSAPRDVEASWAAAVALKERAGLEFLLTPKPTTEDRPCSTLGRWAVAVFPYLEGRMSWEDEALRGLDAQAMSWIERLHEATPLVADVPLPTEDFVPDLPDALRAALDRSEDGPYAERLRALIADSRGRILDALAEHIEHGKRQRGRDLDLVVTHGEPAGNFFICPDGSRHLIDLVELKLAPRERDLQDGWPIPGIDAAVVRFYKRNFVLSEITEYTDRLSSPHTGDPEDDRAWHWLKHYIAEL